MRATCTILLGASGLCWAAGQAVLPDMGMENAVRYEAVVAARDLQAASARLLVVAAGLLVVATLAMAVRLPRTMLVRVGYLLTALGALWLVGGRAAFNLTFYRLTDPQVPRESALAVLDSATGPGFVPLVLTLPALLLGPALLAVGLRRARLAGWWPLITWVLGIGVFLGTEFTIKAGEVIGIALAALALGLIGRAADQLAPQPAIPSLSATGTTA